MLYSLTVISKPFCTKPWEISRLGISGSFKMGLKIELVGSLYEETDPQTPLLSYSGQATALMLPGRIPLVYSLEVLPSWEGGETSMKTGESLWTDWWGCADPLPIQQPCAGSEVCPPQAGTGGSSVGVLTSWRYLKVLSWNSLLANWWAPPTNPGLIQASSSSFVSSSFFYLYFIMEIVNI